MNWFPKVYFDGKRKFFWTVKSAEKKAEKLLNKGTIKSYSIVSNKQTIGGHTMTLEESKKLWEESHPTLKSGGTYSFSLTEEPTSSCCSAPINQTPKCSKCGRYCKTC